jgi:hypothetical protein
MAGQGKYTVYAPESNAKNNLLARLFPNSPTAQYVGKEVDYRNVVVEQGNSILKNGTQPGDSYFGSGVDMDYSGSPDIVKNAEGAWKNAGDPANAYSPDLTSPGPGKTDGVDKSADPGIKSSDIKPTYVPGGPTGGTRNPAEYAKKIASQILGTNSKIKLGSSDSSGT